MTIGSVITVETIVTVTVSVTVDAGCVSVTVSVIVVTSKWEEEWRGREGG